MHHVRSVDQLSLRRKVRNVGPKLLVVDNKKVWDTGIYFVYVLVMVVFPFISLLGHFPHGVDICDFLLSVSENKMLGIINIFSS